MNTTRNQLLPTPDGQFYLMTRYLDIPGAAQHATYWIDRALYTTRQGRAQFDLSAVHDGMEPARFEALMIRILEKGEERAARPPLSPPTPLPTSTAFHRTEAGGLKSSYTEEFSPELKRSVRAASKHRCAHCGMPNQGVYLNTPWNRQTRQKDTLRIQVQGVLHVAHYGSNPDNLQGLSALCSRCHNELDWGHQRGGKLLTQSLYGTLGHTELQRWLNEARALTERAESPLGALQPGGADLVTAVVLRGNSGVPVAPESIARVIPRAAVHAAEQLQTVWNAALDRLRIRGHIAPGSLTLNRPLSLPDDVAEANQRARIQAKKPPRP